MKLYFLKPIRFYSSKSRLYNWRKKYILTSSFAIKKSQFDFADELKIGDVRYKHLTQITIKVQLFWRLAYEMLLYSKTNRLWVISDSKKVVEYQKASF